MTRLAQRLGLTRYEADEHYKSALRKYSENHVSDAIIEINYALELLPNNPEYHAARGFFYLEDGLPKEAQADFEESLKHYPYEMLAHYGLGRIAWDKKDWDEALERFTQAYRAEPKRAETLYHLALALHRKEQNTEAAHYMQLAINQFEVKADNTNKRNAERWLKEFERIAKLQAESQAKST
jgi:tetratricopeptide (TPR) repeat protein